MNTFKKIAATLFLSLLTFTVLSAKEVEKKKERVRFNVELHCESCVRKIMQNIPYEKGVTDLECSLEGQWVDVEYKTDKTDTQKLVQAFKKIGKDAVEAAPAASEKTTPEKKASEGTTPEKTAQ